MSVKELIASKILTAIALYTCYFYMRNNKALLFFLILLAFFLAFHFVFDWRTNVLDSKEYLYELIQGQAKLLWLFAKEILQFLAFVGAVFAVGKLFGINKWYFYIPIGMALFWLMIIAADGMREREKECENTNQYRKNVQGG